MGKGWMVIVRVCTIMHCTNYDKVLVEIKTPRYLYLGILCTEYYVKRGEKVNGFVRI